MNQVKKKNFAISYIKGVAILFIILIHLLDWGDIPVSETGRLLKQVLYTGVVFFMATAGSVVWIAYGKYDDLKKATKRLVWRGAQLIGIYYIYNIIKFFVFDFRTENFYSGFIQAGLFDFSDILLLKSYAVPIPILVTIGVFVMISPIFLFVVKKIKYGIWYVTGLFMALVAMNTYFPFPQNVITDFLHARGNITFSMIPWFMAFVLGFLVAYAGFEKQKKKFVLFFSACVPITLWYAQSKGLSFFLDNSLHPLQVHALGISFAFMFLLIFLFEYKEKFLHKKYVRNSLSALRFLGDSTLWLYVAHWIVIDITIWIFSPKTYLIWPAVIMLLMGFLWWKRAKVQEYAQQYEVTD